MRAIVVFVIAGLSFIGGTFAVLWRKRESARLPRGARSRHLSVWRLRSSEA